MEQEFNFFENYELQGEYEINGKKYTQDKITMRQELDLIQAAEKHDVEYKDLMEKLKDLGLVGFITWLDSQGVFDPFLQVILQDDQVTIEDLPAVVGHNIIKDFFLLNTRIVNELATLIFKSLSYLIQMRKRMEGLKKKQEKKASKK